MPAAFMDAICAYHTRSPGSRIALYSTFRDEVYHQLRRQPVFFRESSDDLMGESQLLAVELITRCGEPQLRQPFRGEVPLAHIATSSRPDRYWRRYLFTHHRSMLRDHIEQRVRQLRDSSPQLQRKLGIYSAVKERLGALGQAKRIEVVAGERMQPRWRAPKASTQPERTAPEVTAALREAGMAGAPALPPDGRRREAAPARWRAWLSELLVSALTLAGRALFVRELLEAVEPFFFDAQPSGLAPQPTPQQRRVQETVLVAYKAAEPVEQSLIRCVATQQGFANLYAQHPQLRTASTRSTALGRANQKILALLEEEHGHAAGPTRPKATAELIYKVVLRALRSRSTDAPDYLLAPPAPEALDEDLVLADVLTDYGLACLHGLDPSEPLCLLGQASAERDPVPGFVRAGWPDDYGAGQPPSMNMLTWTSSASIA